MNNNENSNKTGAVRKRSLSAKEIFQRLFSSDSEGSAEKEKPEKRNLKRGVSLQKTPWDTTGKDSLTSSSSDDNPTRTKKKEGTFLFLLLLVAFDSQYSVLIPMR